MRKQTRKVKQEKSDTPAAAEQPTEGTPASMLESIHSFDKSNTPIAGAKIEPPQPDVDYGSAQYAPMNDNGHSKIVMPGPDVTFGTIYPFQPDLRNPMEIPPFTDQTSSMQSTMAFTTSDRVRKLYSNQYRRRPTSVCTQNSPSDHNGTILRDVGYNFNDDTTVYPFLSKPLTSSGYPIAGLSNALNNPLNHSHGGLSPDEQERLCGRFDCSNFRTMKEHQEGVEMNGWRPSFNEHQGGLPDTNDQFNNHYHTGIPQYHGLPLLFHGQGGIPHAHGLGCFIQLVYHESCPAQIAALIFLHGPLSVNLANGLPPPRVLHHHEQAEAVAGFAYLHFHCHSFRPATVLLLNSVESDKASGGVPETPQLILTR